MLVDYCQLKIVKGSVIAMPTLAVEVCPSWSVAKKILAIPISNGSHFYAVRVRSFLFVVVSS